MLSNSHQLHFISQIKCQFIAHYCHSLISPNMCGSNKSLLFCTTPTMCQLQGYLCFTTPTDKSMYACSLFCCNDSDKNCRFPHCYPLIPQLHILFPCTYIMYQYVLSWYSVDTVNDTVFVRIMLYVPSCNLKRYQTAPCSNREGTLRRSFYF